MGIFDKLGSAQTTQAGSWWPECTVISCIKKVVDRTGPNATRNAGNAVILEEQVIAVIDAGPVGPGGVPKVRQGSKFTYMISDGGARKDTFLGNVKSVLTDLMKCRFPAENVDAITDEEWTKLAEQFMGPEQIFSGMFVKHRAYQVSKKNGDPFTRHAYEEAFSASQVRAVLKELGQLEGAVFAPGELDGLIAAEQAQQGAA